MVVKSISDIADKTNYLVDIPLLINANITEYDISKANISILYSYGIITKEEYELYYAMDKLTREISIGRRMLNDNGEMTNEGKIINATIKKGIILAKHLLLESNNVPMEAVIRVANDAIFINGPILPITSFDLNNNGILVNFKHKNIYNIMLNLHQVTIFIYDNPMVDKLEVEIKGINDNLLYKHEAFIEFICNTVSDLQRNSKESALYTFNDFYTKYINLQLPVSYYREFNSNSGYPIKGTSYYVDNVGDIPLERISIEYNLSVLRQIYSIIMDF